jgi:hypothetical protein
MRLALMALALALSGCATTQQAAVVDTFCLTSQKRLWSIEDSPETIRSAEAWNGAIDKRCGVKRA